MMELLFARRGAAARQIFGVFAAPCVCLFARQRLWCLATVLTIHDCWIFTLHESWSQCDQRKCGRKTSLAIASAVAAIAQLGERQTEDLKVPSSIPGLGKLCRALCVFFPGATPTSGVAGGDGHWCSIVLVRYYSPRSLHAYSVEHTHASGRTAAQARRAWAVLA